MNCFEEELPKLCLDSAIANSTRLLSRLCWAICVYPAGPDLAEGGTDGANRPMDSDSARSRFVRSVETDAKKALQCSCPNGVSHLSLWFLDLAMRK